MIERCEGTSEWTNEWTDICVDIIIFLPTVRRAPFIVSGSLGEELAHQGSVRGIVVDSLNQVIATAGADAKLKFWNFKSKALLHSIDLPTSASLLRLQLNRCAVMR